MDYRLQSRGGGRLVIEGDGQEQPAAENRHDGTQPNIFEKPFCEAEL